MIRKFLSLFLILFFFLFIISSIYLFSYSQSITLSQSKVIYDLPYPGILPDHPLYYFKILRDRILEFATRDYLKKADLYLLYSDKRVAMSLALAKKGKDKQALVTLSKAEKYFLKTPPLLKTSKKQGVNPTADLVNRLKLSNAKHKEIIENFLKELPQGQTEFINQILKLNEEVRKELTSF